MAYLEMEIGDFTLPVTKNSALATTHTYGSLLLKASFVVFSGI